MSVDRPVKFDVEDLVAVEAIVEKIRPHLAGIGSLNQGAVVAELMSIYCAQHFVPDDPIESARIREALLDIHVATVRRLIAIHAAAIGATISHERFLKGVDDDDPRRPRDRPHGTGARSRKHRRGH